mgnify:CR=1 FL=1
MRRGSHGLVELALVGRAVSVERHRNATVALVLVREGEPGADGRLCADDAVAAEEVGIRLQSGSQSMCSVLGQW